VLASLVVWQRGWHNWEEKGWVLGEIKTTQLGDQKF